MHAAMDAVPGFRERATEKQALNQSLELCGRRPADSGGKLVVVPLGVTDKQIADLAS